MIDDEERMLFQTEMASVKPLMPSGKQHLTFKKAGSRRVNALKGGLKTSTASSAVMASKSASSQSGGTEQHNYLTANDMGVEWLSAEQVLSFCSSGLSAQNFKQLRLGKLTIDAVLDLHGETVESACEHFFHFMQRAQQRHCRLVKIIHGKGLHAADGTARLKSHVAKWLQQLHGVLAFHSAPANLGGRGAVLVMLRR